MRPFWTFQLFLAATSAHSPCRERLWQVRYYDSRRSRGAGAPASTGGVLVAVAESGGSRSSAGTGTGGATSAGGSSGTTPGGAGGFSGTATGATGEPVGRCRWNRVRGCRRNCGHGRDGFGWRRWHGWRRRGGENGGTAGVGGAGRTGGAAGAGGAGRTGGAGGSTRACNATSTAGCKAVLPEGCGDGINNQNGMEECDDGNALPGDGCNGTCKVEPHWTCPPAGPCMRNVVCGDSIIGAGEVCDDGNSLDNDGCNSTCTVQDPAYQCIAGQPCVRISQCGNKRIEAGENCDDATPTAAMAVAAVVSSNPVGSARCRALPASGSSLWRWCRQCRDWRSVRRRQPEGRRRLFRGLQDQGCGVCLHTWSTVPVPDRQMRQRTIEDSEACDDGNTKPGDGLLGNLPDRDGVFLPLLERPVRAKLRRRHRVEPNGAMRSRGPRAPTWTRHV